jgi:hypothetical protein
LFDAKFEKAGAIKLLTRDEVKERNPGLRDAQIDELMSKQGESGMTDELFGDGGDETPKTLGTTITDLKGEKAYKKFGNEVAEYIIANGQSQNHIPKFFSELFNSLSDKVTVKKMRNIVTDFDDKLKKKLQEEDAKKREEQKLEKKPKANKKAKLAGVTKAHDTNKVLMDDMFAGDDGEDDGEGDYGDEGDGYDAYARDDIDFM